MHDPWTGKISEYIDGELDATEAAAVRDHLSTCPDCRAIEAELRAVIEVAGNAPPTEPERDLWAGIHAGISGSAPGGMDGAGVTGPNDLERQRARREQRRISFSMWQLAAAAMVLMAIGASAVWVIRDGGESERIATGTIMQGATSSTSVQTVSSVQTPDQTPDDIAALESALDASRDQLDPATVEVVERSLEAIDRAIADARAALEADPGNPYLHRQLDNTMRKKADILRKATRVQRGGS